MYLTLMYADASCFKKTDVTILQKRRNGYIKTVHDHCHTVAKFHHTQYYTDVLEDAATRPLVNTSALMKTISPFLF